MDAKAFSVLVLNDPAIAQHPDEVFKVWSTDRDQDAFRAAMTDHVEVTNEQAVSRVAQAPCLLPEQGPSMGRDTR